MAKGGTVVIDGRFAGFPGVAQGGYVGGLLAGMLDGAGEGTAAEVTLKAPPPIERPLGVEPLEAGRIAVTDDGSPVAEARLADLDVDPPAPVSPRAAEEASAGFPGFHTHPFPGCFACGPDREHGDGLRIFPGRVDDAGLLAAPWTPDPGLAGEDGEVDPKFAWAAADCSQLWALMLSAPEDSEERVVTAGMTTRVEAPVIAGKPHVVVSWPMQRDGRSLFAGAAVYSQGGELSVVSVQRAVAVDGPGVPLGLVTRG